MAALECGTPLSSNSSGLALSWIRYYAGWADKIEGTCSEPLGIHGLAYARHEPIGVIGVIIPWNSPLVAISMTAILAMAAGNAVILTPPRSEERAVGEERVRTCRTRGSRNHINKK